MDRKTLHVIIIFTVLIASVGAFEVNAVSKGVGDLTPEKYMEVLAERGKEDPEAFKTREKFKVLSREKQQKILAYITNADIMAVMVKELLMNSAKRKELYGGDIVITHKESVVLREVAEETKSMRMIDFLSSLFVSEVAAAPALKEYKATHSKEGKVCGLNIHSVYNWVMYSSKNNKEVVKVISGGSYCHNMIPIAIVSKETEQRYVYGNKAHNCVIYKYSPITTPWTTTTIVHHDVLGFANGKSTFRLWS